MVSPFTLFVARGSNVPVRDKRLNAHVRARVVVSQNQETATLGQGSLAVEAPAIAPNGSTTSEPIAPVEALERQDTGFEKKPSPSE